MSGDEEQKRRKGLSKALTHVLEECRMVLPGIQALFGFQLIAVFNPRFDLLGQGGQVLHLVAIVLVALAIALVMTPAAYHRQRLPEGVSEEFVLLASRLLLLSMIPLGLATALEVYLVASVVLSANGPALAIGGALAGTFAALWLGLPRWHGRSKPGTERSEKEAGIVADPVSQA